MASELPYPMNRARLLPSSSCCVEAIPGLFLLALLCPESRFFLLGPLPPLCRVRFLPSHAAFTSLSPSPLADSLQADFSLQTSLFPFISSWHPPMGFSCPSPGDHPMPVSSLKKLWS